MLNKSTVAVVMLAIAGVVGTAALADTKSSKTQKNAAPATPTASAPASDAASAPSGALTREQVEAKLEGISSDIRELADSASTNLTGETKQDTAAAKAKLNQRLDEISRDMAQARDQFAAATGEAENAVRADLSQLLRDLAGKVDQTKKDLGASDKNGAATRKSTTVSSKTAANKVDAQKGKVAAAEDVKEETSEDAAATTEK